MIWIIGGESVRNVKSVKCMVMNLGNIASVHHADIRRTNIWQVKYKLAMKLEIM